ATSTTTHDTAAAVRQRTRAPLRVFVAESLPMRVTVTLLIALMTAATATQQNTAAQQQSPGTLTPQIETVLKSIQAADKGLPAVSEEDGRFLRVMVASRNAKSVLE